MKPQSALKISLLLNFLLLALTAWLLRPAPSSLADTTTTAAAPPAPFVAGHDQDAITREAAPPFRWSRLESTNYLTYIANLRAIGCPAQTIRDLIMADVDGLYAPKREQLRDQEARSGQNLEPRRQELVREESNLIARLLGPPGNRGPMPAANVASAAAADSGAHLQPRPSLPLAFLDPDTNFVHLDDRQQAVIERLRRGFTEELGGQGANPKSLEYAERWRKTQPEYDEILRSLLGQEAFVELQREAARPVRASGQTP